MSGTEPDPSAGATGITARSRAGRFGERPWSRRWVADLERAVPPGSLGTRVQQARIDARHRHVLSLQHSGSVVRLAVRGSQPEPFSVEFTFATLDSSEERLLRSELASTPGGVLGALAGDIPEQAAFRLIPAIVGQTRWTCTCPVDGEPCRHVLAAGMILAEWWERNPEVLFALRGVSVVAPPTGEEAADDPFAYADLWGPAGPRPEGPVAPASDILDLLDGPVVRRLAAAASPDPQEQLRVVSDLDDFYRALAEADP